MKLGQQSSMATAGKLRGRGWHGWRWCLTPGMGATRTQKAMRRLDEPERLFEASLTELEGLGLPAHSAQFCFAGRGAQGGRG